MGPKVRYLGPEVPAEDLIWQDPVPAGTAPSDADVAAFKEQDPRRPASRVGQLVKTAWASASTYPQVRPSRRRQRRAHSPRAAEGLGGQRAGRAGQRACQDRRAARRAVDGRRDRACRHGGGREGGAGTPASTSRFRSPAAAATRAQEWTDVESFDVMEPEADGFRNYLKTKHSVKTEELLLDRAPVARPVGAGDDGAARRSARAWRQPRGRAHGVFTNRKGQLTNDFFVNLLDNDTFWEVVDDERRRGVHRPRPRRQAARSGGRPAPTSSSGRTASFARPPKSMPRRAMRRSSFATSSRPGPR